MPKPPPPLDPNDPVQGFALELRRLRRSAGDPSLAAIARTMSCAHSTVSAYLNGTRLPSLMQLQALVRACRGDPTPWRDRLDVVREQLDRLPAADSPRLAPEERHADEAEKRVYHGAAQETTLTIMRPEAGPSSTAPAPLEKPTAENKAEVSSSLRIKELELLNDINLQLLGGDNSLDNILNFITVQVRSLVGSDHASILLRYGAVLLTASSSDDLNQDRRVNISDSVAGQCLMRGEIIFISDLESSEFRDVTVSIADDTGRQLQSLIVAPIVSQGEAVGVICVGSLRPGSFQRAYRRTLMVIASQLGVAFQHVRYFDSAVLFSDVDRIIVGTGDAREALQRALERVMNELLGLRHVQLSGAQILFLNGSGELEIVYSTQPTDVGLCVPSHSICGRAIRENCTVIVGDVSYDPDYLRMLGPGMKSEIAIPIISGDARLVIGVLNVESTEVDEFYGVNRILLTTFADEIGMLLAFARRQIDITDTLESRNANELLAAVVGCSHRFNSVTGALRAKVLQLRELSDQGSLLTRDSGLLSQCINELFELADQVDDIPRQVTDLLVQEEGDSVDMNECITDRLTEIRLPFNIDVETRLYPNLPRLSFYHCDVVIRNLIRNAVEAMPHGGHLRISTDLIHSPELASGYAKLTVRDTGTGIPDDILPRIFDLDFTTKGAKSSEIGAGLSWVRAFVLRSNGTISVSSTVGIGSEFTVKLPVIMSN